MALIEVKKGMDVLEFMAAMEMQPEIEARLGPARAEMVLAEARHRVCKISRQKILVGVIGHEAAECFMFDRDITVWELDLAGDLAAMYREDRKKLNLYLREAIKERAEAERKMKEEMDKCAEKDIDELAKEGLDKTTVS